MYLRTPPPPKLDLPLHFWDHVKRPISADDCWPWLGDFNARDKLPLFNGRSARGLLYITLGRPLKLNEVLRLTCGTSTCVNPDHVKPVTRQSLFAHRIH
jgi:hypothetical protein